MIECIWCEAQFEVTYDNDDYDTQFCPACGEEITIDLDDEYVEVDLDDE